MPTPDWKLTFLLLLMLGEVCSMNVFPNMSSKRSYCITLVAQHHFHINSTVAVITTNFYDYERLSLFSTISASAEDNLIELLSASTQFSLFILTPTEKGSCCLNKIAGKKTVDYFVFVGSADEVVRCIATFCFERLTNDRSQFMVYLETNTSDTANIVDDTLHMFWRHQHHSVVVLVGSGHKDIHIYAWFPFEETPKVKIIDKCNGTALRANQRLFQPQLPHDLKGRVITAGLVIAPMPTCNRIGGGQAGIEIDLLESMASALNFTVDYRRSEDLIRENDSELAKRKDLYGPWGTVLLRMYSDEVDIAVGGFILTPVLKNTLEYTQPYTQDDYMFFATNDKVLSARTETWIGLITVQMIVVHAFTTMAMQLLGQTSKRRIGDCGATGIMVWSLLTDSSVKVSTMSSRQTLLWAVCAFYAINLNTINKSILTSYLASPIYIENIRTVTDMIESKQPFLLTSAVTFDEIPGLSRSEILKMRKKVVPCPETLPRCLIKFVSVPQYCLAASTGNLRFVESIVPNRKYHPLNRLIASIYPTMYSKKNFFLSRKMTTMVLRSVQAGLVDFWYRKTLRNNQLCDLNEPDWTILRNADANRSVSGDYPDNAPSPYDMTDLAPHFLLLGLGLVLSGAVFIGELLYWTGMRFTVCHPLLLSSGPLYVKDFASEMNVYNKKGDVMRFSRHVLR